MRSSKKCCSHRVTHTYISYEQIWLIKSSSKTAAGAHTNTCNPRCVYCIVANTSTKHNLDVSSFTLGTIPSSFLWHYRIIRREKKKLDLTWFKMSPVKIWCKIATYPESYTAQSSVCLKWWRIHVNVGPETHKWKRRKWDKIFNKGEEEMRGVRERLKQEEWKENYIGHKKRWEQRVWTFPYTNWTVGSDSILYCSPLFSSLGFTQRYIFNKPTIWSERECSQRYHK